MAQPDAEAIRNLVASYCLAADGGDHARWASLFAEDGVLLLAGTPVGRGPAELRQWIAGRALPDGYHMVANLRIDLAESAARAEMNFVTVLAGQTLGAMGRYTGRFVSTSAGWRIGEWRIEPRAPRSTP